MNMLKAYVELNWEIDLKQFAICQAIINYRKAIRTNDPLLKRAARRIFSPIWSARRHPIYRLIEIANEIQLMQLYPEIREVIEKYCVVSRSGIYEQHQGLDAILEELNKMLKTLIPPVPQYHHWKIAARNCKKFFELRSNLFKSIGYNDLPSSGLRTRPESTIECQRFRIHLRSHEFVDPANTRTSCRSLGNDELSDQLKNFTYLAKQARKNYIVEIFINQNSSSFFRKIPITKQEVDMQDNEENMTKAEISLKIETFLEQLSETARKKYSGFRSKKRDELLSILQEIKCLFNSDNEFNNQDSLENS
ncbi:hypothetical protein Glove_19g413 [Diversispora epigaea]|uniref:Uncharacterized protein n=1 Tax=Diversispora epigaea TaxID=1348612 RepID=A0A397JUP9_9GLOM|nr:hypothetical protein Glove_19g413 [Diversispora epigaea]